MTNAYRLLTLAPVAALLYGCPAPAPTNNTSAPANDAAGNAMMLSATNAGNVVENGASNAANNAGEVRTNDDRRRSAQTAPASAPPMK